MQDNNLGITKRLVSSELHFFSRGIFLGQREVLKKPYNWQTNCWPDRQTHSPLDASRQVPVFL